jgi:hypothetical protein
MNLRGAMHCRRSIQWWTTQEGIIRQKFHVCWSTRRGREERESDAKRRKEERENEE